MAQEGRNVKQQPLTKRLVSEKQFTALVWVIIRELPWLVLIIVIYGYIGIFLRNRVKLEPNCLETPW